MPTPDTLAGAMRAAAVVVDGANGTMAALTASGDPADSRRGLSNFGQPGSGTFSQAVASSAFESVFVACLDEANAIVPETLTHVGSSALRRFVAGSWSGTTHSLQDGTTVSLETSDAGRKALLISTAEGVRFVFDDEQFVCAGAAVTSAWRLALLVA